MLATPAAGVGGARSLLPGSQWLEPRWTGAEGAARGREAAVGMEVLLRRAHRPARAGAAQHARSHRGSASQAPLEPFDPP
jgi:hypothetical protein